MSMNPGLGVLGAWQHDKKAGVSNGGEKVHEFLVEVVWDNKKKHRGHLPTRLTHSWWEGFHDRVPTNKHNSEVTLAPWGGHSGRTSLFLKFHERDRVSDGPSNPVLAPKGQKGYPILRETHMQRHDKVRRDSCGLISNPHQPLRSAARSQPVIW